MKLFIVTMTLNDYNQYGDYFVGYARNYHDALKLTPYNRVGRRKNEYEWYHITEMEVDQLYIQKDNDCNE